MKGYIENNIVVLGDVKEIFQLTNDIERWPELFTEYENVQILERNDKGILFKLTTIDGKSWTSRRVTKEQLMVAEAFRIHPKFPFLDMNIIWKYEKLPQNIGVVMTWIQKFDVDPGCGHDIYDMESYLNRSSRKQMKAVKQNVERLLNDKTL